MSFIALQQHAEYYTAVVLLTMRCMLTPLLTICTDVDSSVAFQQPTMLSLR